MEDAAASDLSIKNERSQFEIVIDAMQQEEEMLKDRTMGDATATYVTIKTERPQFEIVIDAMQQGEEEEEMEMDRTVEDVSASGITISDEKPRFEVLEGATQRGKPMLIDRLGYAFTVKKKTAATTSWWCSVRGKQQRCPASVSEKKGVFKVGRRSHSHSATPDIMVATKLVMQSKKEGLLDISKSAAKVIVDVMAANVDFQSPCSVLANPTLLRRRVNHYRRRRRPAEPVMLDFEVDESFIGDGFLKDSIKVGDKKHLVFATETQLSLLAKAKTWYVDSIVHLVKSPFTQLFTIHAFLKNEHGEAHLVPLVFILMSRRTKKDYKKILKSVKLMLPTPPSVEVVVADFERAIWIATTCVFLKVTVRGCCYLWSQDVWQKAQEIDIRASHRRQDVYELVRKLLVLPFLPAEHIVPAFEKLEKKCSQNEKLNELTFYIRTTWIENSDWTTTSRSVFMHPMRTNNDFEGWHRRLHDRATNGSLPFYVLVPLLKEEAKTISIKQKVLCDKKLERYQRSRYSTLPARVFNVWDAFNNGDKTINALLREIARLYEPITK